jgi:hypothetical protein
MAVHILPCCFHLVLIVGRQIQFVLCVGIVMRAEHLGTLHPHLSHEFRAVILWRFNRRLNYNALALRVDRNPLLYNPKQLLLARFDFDEAGVNVVQVEDVVLEPKYTFGRVSDSLLCPHRDFRLTRTLQVQEPVGFSANGADQKQKNANSKDTAQQFRKTGPRLPHTKRRDGENVRKI